MTLITGHKNTGVLQVRPALEAAAAADEAAGGWHGSQFSPGLVTGTAAALASSRSISASDTNVGHSSSRSSVDGHHLAEAGGAVERGLTTWQVGQPAKVLVAVPTANVWDKTELLLHSLAAVQDPFELLVAPCPPPPPFSGALVGSIRAPSHTPHTYTLRIEALQWDLVSLDSQYAISECPAVMDV